MKKKKKPLAEPKFLQEVGENVDRIMEASYTADDSESLLSIDQNELDKEWTRQPKLYHEYATELAHARRKLDELEAELKVVRAEVDRAIRDKPTKYDLADKPTEASIASTIFLQLRHQKAQRKVIIAQEHVNITEAMVKSLDHKKAALENMVRLHGQDYFATPKADSQGQQEIEQSVKNRVRRPKERR